MKKYKLNLNQRKAISDLFINLSSSIITLGVVVPLTTGDIFNSKNLIIFFSTVIFTLVLVLLSNILLT